MNLCASTSSRDGQDEKTTKWFQASKSTRFFQGAKEEVERKGKNTATTTHHSKDPIDHYNIDGHFEDKCWKLHPKLNQKGRKNDSKKKNMLSIDLRNQVENN